MPLQNIKKNISTIPTYLPILGHFIFSLWMQITSWCQSLHQLFRISCTIGLSISLLSLFSHYFAFLVEGLFLLGMEFLVGSVVLEHCECAQYILVFTVLRRSHGFLLLNVLFFPSLLSRISPYLAFSLSTTRCRCVIFFAFIPLKHF